MKLDQDTKSQVKAFFQDWVSSIERRAAVNTEIKETIEATSQLLNLEKKKIRRMFRLMENLSFNEEYDLLQICEEVSKE